MNNIEQISIQTYSNNLEYLKLNHNNIYKKIELFEIAIESNIIKEKFELRYQDNYFDVYDIKENTFLYNTNSIEYSKELVSNIDFSAKKNSFKTFYDYTYEEEVVDASKKASILSSPIFGNAPIVHYINQNLTEEENLKTIYNFIVFGVVLGIHIPEIIDKMKAKVYHIIEPSLELFRLSLFVTDYSRLFEQSQVYFYIADEESEFTQKFKYIYYKTFFYNHYIKFFMFTQNCNIYVDYIQNLLVSQTHNLYSYNREILSLDRTYNYLKEGFNYINISKTYDFEYIKKKPILMLAAGPSLKNDVDFIKSNKNKFIIVSIYSLLPFLEENGIIPDVVTQYDEDDEVVMETIKKVNNLDLFKDTIFLFASHLDPKVMTTFIKSNIYVFQGLFEAKKDFSTLTSPSIGEITYALINILGFRNIYLLGLDMALDSNTNQTHYEENYTGSFNTKNLENLENSYSFRNSFIKIKGNFIDEINTLPLFKISIDHINLFTKRYKHLHNLPIYNLSNGAYFEDIQPLKIKEIHTEKFEEINKKALHKEFKTFFDSISEDFFNDEDTKNIKEKIEDAKKLKIKLQNFKAVKNSSIENFKNSLHLLHEELCKAYACNDLQKILSNYFNNNIHYVFHLLNIQNISNPKKHIKELQKLFYLQSNKIIEEYIKIISLK